jgi:hypothetical protein
MNPTAAITASASLFGGDVVTSVESPHGEKYVVDGSVSSQTETRHSRMV